MADEIGPKLPAHLVKKNHEETLEADNFCANNTTIQEAYGPILPGSYNCNNENDKNEKEGDEKEIGLKMERRKQTKTKDMYGPALPPDLLVEATRSIGPSLPPIWNPESVNEEDIDDDFVGPALPKENDVVDGTASKRLEFEHRAMTMKNKITGKEDGKNEDNKVLKRETWMTELPPELGANIGIVPRTFKKRTLNSTEADRSVWTETPKDKERKKKEQTEKGASQNTEETHEIKKRDLEMQQRVQQHNAEHRGKSLLEMHQQERKKKKGSGPEERRSFDRNVDLAHKNVDKKAISSFMQKANKFNSKFENAKQGNKFL